MEGATRMSDNGTVFTRTDSDGKTHELTAYSPADHVKLRFDGWREKAKPTKSASKAASAKADEKSK